VPITIKKLHPLLYGKIMTTAQPARYELAAE
jgi:hypothetical protein